MLQYNGKIIGVANQPSTTTINSAANGIWSLKAIEFHKRNNRWPLQPGLPSSPSVSINAVGTNQLLVDIQAPTSNGGIPITGYLLEYSINNTPYNWINYIRTNIINNINVTGLVNGTTYVFRSLAFNAFGASSYSQISSPGTPVAILPPGVPTNVVANRGDGSAFLTWLAPADIGGASIADYTIQYSSNSGLSWTTFIKSSSISTNATVTGLSNGTSYIFRVAAVNLGGSSSFSNSSNSIIPDATPVINILTQPLNDRVLSYAEAGTFITSGIVSNNNIPTYQWQVWTQGPYYGNSVWYDIPDTNSHILQISKNSLSNNGLYETYDGSGYMVRSILSYPDAVSVTGRHAHLHLVAASAYTSISYDQYGYDSIYSSINTNINGDSYNVFELDTNMYIVIYGDMYEMNNYSWYTGSDKSVYLQKSTNTIDWTNISAINLDPYGTSLPIPAEPEIGDVYYRILVQDLWPYNVIDGSISRSENPYIGISNRYKITWVYPP